MSEINYLFAGGKCYCYIPLEYDEDTDTVFVALYKNPDDVVSGTPCGDMEVTDWSEHPSARYPTAKPETLH